MTGAATGAVGVKGRGGADGLPHRLHLLQDVQDRLFGLRKVVELDSHSSPAVLSLSAVADLAHHLEGDGRPGGCLNLDKNPAADEISFGARKKSRVLKKFKASAENGNVQDLASAPHPRWATLDRPHPVAMRRAPRMEMSRISQAPHTPDGPLSIVYLPCH